MGLLAGQAQSTNRRLQFPGLQASWRLETNRIGKQKDASLVLSLSRPRCRHCTSPAANWCRTVDERAQQVQGFGIPWEVGLRGTGWMRLCWTMFPLGTPSPSHTIPSSRPPRLGGVMGKTWISADTTETGPWWTYHCHLLAMMTNVPGQGKKAEAQALSCVTEAQALPYLIRALQHPDPVKIRHGRSFPTIVFYPSATRGEVLHPLQYSSEAL